MAQPWISASLGPTEGSGNAPWPSTCWSVIRRARDASGEERRVALDELLHLYYEPVLRFFVRALRVRKDLARDLTHDFFVKVIEKNLLKGLRHETSFRGFLKVCCRRHLLKWWESEAVRRRALEAWASRSPEQAVRPPPAETAAALIDDEFRRHYLAESLRRLQDHLSRKGKAETFAIFEARVRFDGDRPEQYAALAERFGKRVYDIRNQLSAARRIFRRELRRLAAEWSDDPSCELRELGLLRYVHER